MKVIRKPFCRQWEAHCQLSPPFYTYYPDISRPVMVAPPPGRLDVPSKERTQLTRQAKVFNVALPDLRLAGVSSYYSNLHTSFRPDTRPSTCLAQNCKNQAHAAKR